MLHAHCVKPKLVDQVAFMNNFIDPGAFDPAFHMPIVFSPLPLMAGCQAAHNVALANRNRAGKPQSIQTTRSFQPDYTSPRVSAVGTIAKKFMLNADDILPLNMDLGSYGPVIPGSMFTVVKDLGNIKRDICTVSDRGKNPSGKMADEWTGEVASLATDNGPAAID